MCRQSQDIVLQPFNGFEPAVFLTGGNDTDANKSSDELVTFNRGSGKTQSGIWWDLAARKRRTKIGEYEQIMLKGNN